MPRPPGYPPVLAHRSPVPVPILAPDPAAKGHRFPLVPQILLAQAQRMAVILPLLRERQVPLRIVPLARQAPLFVSPQDWISPPAPAQEPARYRLLLLVAVLAGSSAGWLWLPGPAVPHVRQDRHREAVQPAHALIYLADRQYTANRSTQRHPR